MLHAERLRVRKSTGCSATRLDTKHVIGFGTCRVAVGAGMAGCGAGKRRTVYEGIPLVCIIAITFSLILQSACASTDRAKPRIVSLPSPDNYPSTSTHVSAPLYDGEQDGEEMGAKSSAVKMATLALAQGIRSGSRIFHRLIGYMDGKAARVFRKYSSRLADELDSIANIPDITVIVVREKIFYFMTNTLILQL